MRDVQQIILCHLPHPCCAGFSRPDSYDDAPEYQPRRLMCCIWYWALSRQGLVLLQKIDEEKRSIGKIFPLMNIFLRSAHALLLQDADSSANHVQNEIIKESPDRNHWFWQYGQCDCKSLKGYLYHREHPLL